MLGSNFSTSSKNGTGEVPFRYPGFLRMESIKKRNEIPAKQD
jgi:hypothetical protein